MVRSPSLGRGAYGSSPEVSVISSKKPHNSLTAPRASPPKQRHPPNVDSRATPPSSALGEPGAMPPLLGIGLPANRSIPLVFGRILDSEDLLLLGLEVLVADDALIPKLGESFELTHVLRLGCRGSGTCRAFHRLFLAAKVLSHFHP